MLKPHQLKPVLCTVFYFMIQFVCHKLYLLEIASEVIVYSGIQKGKRFYHLFVKDQWVTKLFLLSHRQIREHV